MTASEYGEFVALADLMTDTHPDIVAMLVERWRTQSSMEKAVEIDEFCTFVDEWTAIGVRQRYPDASADEIRLRVIALRTPRRLMIDAYGWDPDAMGR